MRGVLRYRCSLVPHRLVENMANEDEDTFHCPFSQRLLAGLDPDDWKPFDGVGAGTKEIRINLDDGWFRVMYVAKFPEAVYVLHCFKKKTTSTSKHDKDITAARYKTVIQERSKK